MYVHACMHVYVLKNYSIHNQMFTVTNLFHSESQTTKQKFQQVTTVNAFISLSNLVSTAYDQ